MNFGIIFLCLLIGAVIGFEVGKYMTQKKISELLGKFSEDLTKKAKEAEERRDKLRKDFDKVMDDILEDLKKDAEKSSIKEEKEHADLNNRPVRPVYLNNFDPKIGMYANELTKQQDRGDEA